MIKNFQQGTKYKQVSRDVRRDVKITHVSILTMNIRDLIQSTNLSFYQGLRCKEGGHQRGDREEQITRINLKEATINVALERRYQDFTVSGAEDVTCTYRV